jgi:hypothetical protein
MIVPSEYIADKLETGVFGTSGVDLFVRKLRATPDNQIAVLDGPPMNPDTNNNFVYYEPTVGLLIRNLNYLVAYKTSMNILEFLNKTIQDIYVDTESISWNVVAVLHLSGPMMLFVDDNERSVLSLNFRMQIEPV